MILEQQNNKDTMKGELVWSDTLVATSREHKEDQIYTLISVSLK